MIFFLQRLLTSRRTLTTDAFRMDPSINSRGLCTSASLSGVGTGAFGPPRDNIHPLRELCLENGNKDK